MRKQRQREATSAAQGQTARSGRAQTLTRGHALTPCHSWQARCPRGCGADGNETEDADRKLQGALPSCAWCAFEHLSDPLASEDNPRVSNSVSGFCVVRHLCRYTDFQLLFIWPVEYSCSSGRPKGRLSIMSILKCLRSFSMKKSDWSNFK